MVKHKDALQKRIEAWFSSSYEEYPEKELLDTKSLKHFLHFFDVHEDAELPFVVLTSEGYVLATWRKDNAKVDAIFAPDGYMEINHNGHIRLSAVDGFKQLANMFGFYWVVTR